MNEIFLYHLAFITAADDKLLKTITGIQLHDMPDNRHSADFNHRFRTELGFFSNPRSLSPGKDDDLHKRFSFTLSMAPTQHSTDFPLLQDLVLSQLHSNNPYASRYQAVVSLTD